MSTVTEEIGIYTLVKNALEATDGDEALGFAQWKAWIMEDERLYDRALRAAWSDAVRRVRNDSRRFVLSQSHERDASEQLPKPRKHQQSSAFGLVDVARQATESIYAWIIPYANVSLKQARRSDLAKAEDSLMKTINTQTWQCLFVRELRAGLKNELQTVPDRYSESDIEKLMERAHAAVYRRDKSADKAAD